MVIVDLHVEAAGEPVMVLAAVEDGPASVTLALYIAGLVTGYAVFEQAEVCEAKPDAQSGV
jgi:hypothetical protein